MGSEINRTLPDGDDENNPIAICGMALRLPGGLSSPQHLWDFLLAKGDARGRVPRSRYNVSAYYSPSGPPGTVSTEYGYFLDESVDLESLDASRFTLSRAELLCADPQLRCMLEVVRECFDDAGAADFRGQKIGCYMGFYGEDWLEMQNKDPLASGPFRVDGYSDFMLSNRVSYEMDIRGPSMTVRTACSSALVGLHEACQAIQRGDCEAAIVGGASIILAPAMTAFMTEKGVLSPDGSCKTFSDDADGYARGEAITAVLIKPLKTALRDGNPVRAVIRSTMSNHDGKTQGITHPSADTQEAMIRAAYHSAGITDFGQTAFVECHGTGTSIGDPVETDAVGRVFGDSGVFIGSVKPNLGHSEGASGLTSLMKAVLSLEHKIIPPNIKFSKPNPKIPFERCKLTVPTEPTAWPQDRSERISVNSFGIGGSNVHVILDSAQSCLPVAAPAPLISSQESSDLHLLLLSASSKSSLDRMVARYRELIEDYFSGPQKERSIQDLAYTLAVRREHLPHRAFMVARSAQLGFISLGKRIASQTPGLVMVFTGQGAQWPRMGRELLMNPTLCFRDTIRKLDQCLAEAQAPQVPGWTLEEELHKPPRAATLQTARILQPLSTAVQIALVDVFFAAGVEPQAVVGHSSGEIAAAYAVGALTAKEAITMAWLRGRAAESQTRAGAMAAIGLGSDDVRSQLPNNVIIACENSDKSVTISGDAEEVKKAVNQIQARHPQALARLLKVDKAYHSHHMVEIGQEYHSMMRDKLVGGMPKKAFYSSVTGELEQGTLDAMYWQKNLESPVLFRSAILSVLRSIGNAAFVEIGPHSALAGPLRQIMAEAGSSAPYIAAMTRNENCMESLLAAMGKLYELNVPIDFGRLMPSGRCLPGLPAYAWDHSASYWQESRMSREWRDREFADHPLLGVRQLEATSLEPSWRKLLNVDSDAAWLYDHQIEDNVIFPCAGYVAMVGEALRQVGGGSQDAFTLRDVVLSSALVLPKQSRTELVTTLHPYRLTESLDSKWWDFSICSYNGHTWTKHCTGQGTSEAEVISARHARHGQSPLPRKLEPRRYYNLMNKAGLQFGPHFQRLEAARCGTRADVATAVLSSDICGDEAHYHLHPTVLDAVIQSAFFAALKGLSDVKPYRRVPTRIGLVTLRRGVSSHPLDVSTAASLPQNAGDIIGQVQQVWQNGTAVLHMEGLRLSPLQGAEAVELNISQYPARLTWRPHIAFTDVSRLIKPSLPRHVYTPLLDELTRFCMVISSRHSKTVLSRVPHMQKYDAWMQRQLLLMPPTLSAQLECLDDDAIMRELDGLVSRMLGTPVEACAIAMQKVASKITDLLSGALDALDLFLPDGTLYKMYLSMDACDRSDFLRHLAHTKPNLRVLEIGAGTGASTVSILEHLVSLGSLAKPMYSKYTFTDISPGFFASAKNLLREHSNIEYRTLDISRDPDEQGFLHEKYDLIVATNVLHATEKLNTTLQHVRKLLESDGRLLMLDLHSTSKWPNYVFGTLPGWWLGEADGRADEPYVSPDRWKIELTNAGFDGADAIVLDGEIPHQLSAIIVAHPRNDDPGKHRQTITLLHDTYNGHAQVLHERLREQGYSVQACRFGDPVPDSQDVLCLVDYDHPFFENIDEASYKAFQNVIAKLGSSSMLWITRASHIACTNPKHAQTIGAFRTLRTELLLDVATCEVDDFDSSIDRVIDVFAHFQARHSADVLKPDFEYAIANGVVQVARIYPFAMDHDSPVDPHDQRGHEDRRGLSMAQPGRLSTLQWQSLSPLPLRDNSVKVQIYAVGLNFRDVLCALGIVPYPAEGLGLEAAGIVLDVGFGVKDLHRGDRVMLLGNGSFSTHTTVRDDQCQRIPDSLTFEDAAGMPAVFATVIYSLINVGHLQKGQSILIHSACGGIGLAAIQLAKMIGAEIFATVGSQKKVTYLTKTVGIPENRIFSSRDTTFVEGVMRETEGRGVDLVLNSLSGELLHSTWSCVAEFGTMVEIGKRDLLGGGRLDMGVFLANRTFACVDLDELKAKKPHICKELLRSILRLHDQGHITSVRPITQFDASSVQHAFRHMQQGQQIGKTVISMRDATGNVKFDELTNTLARPALRLDENACYLLVGGLGGLGRSVSRYLVGHGARRLIFLSRSAGNNLDDLEFVRELASMDCEATLVQGSITSTDDVERTIRIAGPALKGIMQCTMVLRDEAFLRMSLDDWKTASDPKVHGTWLLHESTLRANIELDFFLVFSSLSGTLGTPGQANYAGANTFLDAFVQYRNSLGLAASSINIGAVMDVGAASLDDSLMQRMAQASALGIMETELLEHISAAISHLSAVKKVAPSSTSNRDMPGFVDTHTFVTGLGTTLPLSDPENRAFHRTDRRMALYHNDTGATSSKIDSAGGDGDSLKAFLSKIRAAAGSGDDEQSPFDNEETVTFLAMEIGRKLFSFLLRPEEDIDLGVPLSQLGMDSLVSVEMRSWWRQAFAFDITVLELLGMGNLKALGRHAATGIAGLRK